MGLSKANKAYLYLFHGGKCEECRKKFPLEAIEIHKINPKLGYLNHRNLKVVCSKCHDLYSAADRVARGIQSG